MFDSIHDHIRKIAKKWSGKVKPKIKVKEGIFAEGSGQEIATYLLGKGGGKAKAMQRLNFYINRAGENLTNAGALNKAKEILEKK